MALVIADLVQETTSTVGTGTLTLSGAVPGFQTFAAIGNANTTYYRIKSGTALEVGIGTYTLSGTTLSRDTVLYSSAGGTTLITVAAGATVICTYPAEKAVAFDANGLLTLPDASALKWTSDLTLYRDAANTLTQRNAANSQVSQLYNTYSDASNYVRSSLSFVTYSGALYTKLAAESAGTGAANIGIALSPKGTGAITAQVPDGTAAGGNARGANSIDLQTKRNYSTSVASNFYAIAIGNNNTASGGSAGAESGSVAIGSSNTASSVGSVAIGRSNSASAQDAVALGNGGVANKLAHFAFGYGQFTTAGDAQMSYFAFRGLTSDAVATILYLNGKADLLVFS